MNRQEHKFKLGDLIYFGQEGPWRILQRKFEAQWHGPVDTEATEVIEIPREIALLGREVEVLREYVSKRGYNIFNTDS